MRDWIKIAFALALLALVAFVAMDIHFFLKNRMTVIQEDRDCKAAQLITELDTKCDAMWPKDSEACRKQVRRLVREDL